jgi:hypothetical protein
MLYEQQKSAPAQVIRPAGPAHQEEIQREMSRLDVVTQKLLANIDELHQRLERGVVMVPPTPETAGRPPGPEERPITALGQGINDLSNRVGSAANRLQFITASLGV